MPGRRFDAFVSTEMPERPADPAVRKANFRRIVSLFAPYRRRLGAVSVLIVFSAALGAISPFLLREVLDVAIPDENVGLLTALVAGMVAIPIVTGTLGVWQTLLSNQVGQAVMHDLRTQVYRHLQRLSLAFFTRTRTGEVQSRIANVVWIEAIIHRPVIRVRTSSSARRPDSRSKRSARSSVRPIVFPRRIPETESDSWTSDETSASDACRSAVTFFRCSPTRFVNHTKSGSSASANAASRQSSRSIATTVASTVVTFERTDVAVDVTTVSIPPMSFAMRLCTSPVRVRVKNASESRCRCR